MAQAHLRGEPLAAGQTVLDQEGRRWRFEFVTRAKLLFVRLEKDPVRTKMLPASSFIDVTIEGA